MEVSIRNRQRTIKTDLSRIEAVLRAAMCRLGAGGKVRGRNLAAGRSLDPMKASVGVMLVGDREMRNLNRVYRGRDSTTDVLSFSQLEGAPSPAYTPELGDIVISPAQASSQAVERGNTLEQEIDLLLIHGLLHLVGYDHEKNRYQEKKMKAMEKELAGAVKKMVG
jgi:probable rRNA maturation factor